MAKPYWELMWLVLNNNNFTPQTQILAYGSPFSTVFDEWKIKVGNGERIF